MRYWLMKTEPEDFSIDHLAQRKTEPWTGVRNFMARNHMRAMTVGDGVLFYHSSCDPPGVAGLARVSKTGIVDPTQFDPASKYHDPKSPRDAPRWDCVEVAYGETLPTFVSIADLRAEPALAGMLCLRKGMRLSVQPVTAAEWKTIVKLGRRKATQAPKPAATAPAKRAARR